VNIPKLVAHLTVHRPKTLAMVVAAIVVVCVLFVKSRAKFDSEVLNLLPAQFEAVQALKELNSSFSQGTELTFALQGPATVLSEFEEHFLQKLSAEPWVVRVFTGSPMETPEGLADLQLLVPPLLLNLEPQVFQQAITALAPEAIAARLHQMKLELESGSPKAEMQLSVDPLGLLGPAMKPLTSIYGVDRGHSLASKDGTVRVVPVVTTQKSLEQPECKAMMAQVGRFKSEVVASWKGEAPIIHVTGRSAYVAEISSSMERDISVTSIISILSVSALFFLGFRRIMPLIGLTLILALSCFVAFTVGCLIFDKVSMIAVAFCSILVGLGDDFSLLLYNRYLHARRDGEAHEAAIATSVADVGKGIFYVALTTGLGFLALLFSGSSGFAQLGVLIAVGVVLCGVFMCGFLFLFILPQHADGRPDPFHRFVDSYVARTLARPGSYAVGLFVVALAIIAFAASPFLPVRFDTNPRSLEPKHSQAAVALKVITDHIPAALEPVILLIHAKDAQEAHDSWTKASRHMDELVSQGYLGSTSLPTPLMISPQRVEANRAVLRGVDLVKSRQAYEQALEREGFNKDSFGDAFALFDELGNSMKSEEDLRGFYRRLPAESNWWFLLDRFFSKEDPNVAAAFIKPAKVPTTVVEQQELEEKVRAAGVPLAITGWSYAMLSLVPWARSELLWFSFAVGGGILALLAVAYREWQAWFIHTCSLLLALAATVATLKVTGIRLNLLNALAFPLVIGVGVDYGMHILSAARSPGNVHEHLATVMKPLVICGLTTMSGFGALTFAHNPALSSLGQVCALGVFCCLVSSVVFILPAYRVLRRSNGQANSGANVVDSSDQASS
jgi:predicted RND superfamily exporter protein